MRVFGIPNAPIINSASHKKWSMWWSRLLDGRRGPLAVRSKPIGQKMNKTNSKMDFQNETNESDIF